MLAIETGCTTLVPIAYVALMFRIVSEVNVALLPRSCVFTFGTLGSLWLISRWLRASRELGLKEYDAYARELQQLEMAEFAMREGRDPEEGRRLAREMTAAQESRAMQESADAPSNGTSRETGRRFQTVIPFHRMS